MMIVASYITHDGGTLYRLVHEDDTWEVHTRFARGDENMDAKGVKWCATEFEARTVFERLVTDDVTDFWQKKGGM